ncbi:hypothetical protein BDW02DRAFT_538764, partial [Decorospora gaudefroyi]
MITNIKVLIDNIEVNFMDLIKEKSSFIKDKHIDSINSFDSLYKFYLCKDAQRKSFILAIKNIDKHSVDKIMYSLNGV